MVESPDEMAMINFEPSGLNAAPPLNRGSFLGEVTDTCTVPNELMLCPLSAETGPTRIFVSPDVKITLERTRAVFPSRDMRMRLPAPPASTESFSVNAASGNFRLFDFAPPQASFRDDVIKGLEQPKK